MRRILMGAALFIAALTVTLNAQTVLNVLNPALDLSGKTLVTAEGNRTISGTFTYSVPVLFATGTTGAPGLVGSADTTTGMQMSVASIGWSLSAVQRMLLNGSGLTVYGVNVVDNTGTVTTTALGTGVANSGTFLRGDRTWTAAMVGWNVVGKTTNYSAALGDLVEVTSGAITVTLPAASTCTAANTVIGLKNDTTNAVTIARTGADTIDGATSFVTNGQQYESFDFVCNAAKTGWMVR